MAEHPNYLKTLPQDASAGLVVFLVALPLCLGVALASGAPLVSGLMAGVVGGLVVSWLSGSHTSVSGPAAGLTAIVATQINMLGSFEAFLVAVMLAGMLQVGIGALKAGSLAAFFPSSVIKGLLSAIGIILILKQIPHLFGHSGDWLGDMSFVQAGGGNTISGLFTSLLAIHKGVSVIGLVSIAVLVAWDKTPLKKGVIPAPLVVVLGGVAMALGFEGLGEGWAIPAANLVQVPVADSLASVANALPRPDFSAITNSNIAIAAITIAVVASLETLLNLEAVDKLDFQKRVSPPNRELMAQGAGNIVVGLLGGLPITSVIVRSSVNISSGGKTRVASFVHGALLLGMVVAFPQILNLIPFSCLAAVLLVTGFKLATPSLFRQMHSEGRNQFLPYLGTIAAIVFTDLLIGILIGMAIASMFILQSNLRAPMRKISERHASGKLLRIELANTVTFLNRAALRDALHSIPHGNHVVLDARNTLYMDPDITDLIHEFETEIAPAHKIELSMIGFEDHYEVDDRVLFVDVSTRDVQEQARPEQIFRLLRDGNKRFVAGEPIARDRRRQVDQTSGGQYPLAVILSCMDSRTATETIFDLGLGDVLSIRVAGNLAAKEQLGSMELGLKLTGVKVLVVLGHTQCGAITSTIEGVAGGPGALQPSDGENLATITGPIAESVREENPAPAPDLAHDEAFVRKVTVRNIRRAMEDIPRRSAALRQLIDAGQLGLVGAIYEVESGVVEFIDVPAALQPSGPETTTSLAAIG